MKKITILDFSTGIVYIRELPEHLLEAQIEDIMDYFCELLNISESDCEYMVGDLIIDKE